jgi:hypothetical protein
VNKGFAMAEILINGNEKAIKQEGVGLK